jgi:hypothetical protein
MARRVSETERRRLGLTDTPEEPTPAFYDPEEAFEVFDRPEDVGSGEASVPLFDVSAFADLPEDSGTDAVDHESVHLRPARKRRGLFAAWLFGGGAGRGGRPRAHEARTNSDEDGAEAPSLAAVDDAQLVISGIHADDGTEPSLAPPVDEEAAADDALPLEAASERATSTGAEPELDAALPLADAALALESAAVVPDDALPPAEDVVAGDEESEEAPERRVRPVRRRRSSRAHRQRRSIVDEPAEAGPERKPSAALARVRTAAWRGTKVAVTVVAIIVVLMGALYGTVIGVNAFARWNALRLANAAGASTATVGTNLLVIGVKDGVAVGFTALKAERANNRVLGIAIPEGAFVEVPGQGFERIGASYTTGASVSMDTVTNYLGVAFRRYIVVDGDTYQALLASQNVAGLMAKVTGTDLTAPERASFLGYFATVKTKDVWIVPLPVKPVAVGDQRYFEPQRAQVADLLLQWWGVKVSEQKSTPRVIVYNGVGTPGLAGLAAQQLIRSGFSVVNSGNAQNFGYKTTQILLYHGTQADAEAVRSSLGVGQIVVQSAPQDLTDMIVIIGSDYRPPIDDASTATTQGAQ